MVISLLLPLKFAIQTWFCNCPQYCRKSFVWWMYEINLANRLSQAWVHFVNALASFLTDHRMSGLPIRAKYKHIKTTCEHTFDNSPTVSNSSFLKWWSVQAWLKDLLCSCSNSLFANSQYRQRIPSHVLPYHKTKRSFSRAIFPTRWLLSCSGGDSWFKHFHVFINKYFRSICIHIGYVPGTHGQEMMLVFPGQTVSSISST